MSKGVIRQSKGDLVFTTFNFLLLGIFTLVVLYPLIYILSASISSPQAVISGEVWLWPVEPSLEGYRAVFRHPLIMKGYMNSFIYMAVGTAINVFMTVIAAYPLSRNDFDGRNLFTFLFAFTMMFSGGMIPTYLLIKDLGMLNTRWALLLPSSIGVWNMIITRTYFQNNIPRELLEASQLDGCNDFKFLKDIVIPLSAPILAVITLFYAVGHWNSFFSAMIYLRKKDLFPLQVVLRQILIQNQVEVGVMNIDPKQAAAMEALRELLKYSLIVVASLPVLILYPFIQRYFVKGIMVGAIKG